MIEPVVIDKNRKLLPAQDFAFLREQGLQYIRELSGRIWTDHNSHDPGITILELLCYALTDLGYRTGFDVKDLLATEDGSSDPPEISGLFPPQDILPCAPLTIDDYRRLLLRVEGVRNAWLDPMTDPTDGENYLRSEVAIFADCLDQRLSYEPLNADGQANHPVRPRGLYNVLLELEIDDLLGPLNESQLVFQVTRGKLKGVVVSLDLRDANSVPSQIDFRPDFAAVVDIVDVVTNYKGFAATLKLDTDGGPVSLENVVVRILNDRPAAGEDPVDVDAADIEQLLADDAPGGIVPLFWQKQQMRRQTIDSVCCVLHAHRNLCEDFLRVRPINAQHVAVCADIEVTADADLEEVQARVFFAIEQYFNPPVRYYSLKELLREGYGIDEIFDGPYIAFDFECDGRRVFSKPGFVKRDDLRASELRSSIYVSDIINAVMDLPGVAAVRNMLLRPYDANGEPTGDGQKWCLAIPPDHQPVLDIQRSKILFFKENLPYRAEPSEFEETLEDLRGTARKSAYVEPDQVPEMARGRFRDASNFFTIQHDLPVTYGAGTAGLTTTADDRRVAQARQLKAYLTLYDQYLADYLAQLGNIRRLFSLDPTLGQTYFTQYLSAIAGTRDVFEDEFYIDKTMLQDDQQRTRMTENEELFHDRRNRLLDHLIARFAESFTDYVLLTFNLEGDRLKAGTELIADKINFLREYPLVSRQRHKAFNYRPESQADLWDTANVSGLEKRVSRLLGIANFERRDLACDAIFDALFTLEKSDGKFRVRINDGEGQALFRSRELFSTSAAALKAARKLYPVIRRDDSYEVDASGGVGGVFFSLRNNGTSLTHDERYDTEADAVRAIRGVIDRYDALLVDGGLCDDEGFHLIEHILLRPTSNKDRLLDACVATDCNQCGDEDPYSFRMQVVLPYWPRRFQNLDFRQFFERTLRLETPAHIHVRVCWIGNQQMSELDEAYRNWIEAKAAKQPDATKLREATSELISILQRLKTVYPAATLHDCDAGTGERPVRIGSTNLGIF